MKNVQWQQAHSKPECETKNPFYSELPSCFFSVNSQDFDPQVIRFVVNHYRCLNNEKTLVFKIGEYTRATTRNSFMFSRLHWVAIIDFVFKELTLRELASQTSNDLSDAVNILLVIQRMNHLSSLLSLEDMTQEGTLSFKLKTIIEKGKRFGIGIVASSCQNDPLLSVFFQNKYRVVKSNLGKNRVAFRLNPTTILVSNNKIVYIPFGEKASQLLQELNRRRKPFNKSYKLLIFSNNFLDLSEEQMAIIKTFKLQQILKVNPIAEILQDTYPIAHNNNP
jgi:hypothetical protein